MPKSPEEIRAYYQQWRESNREEMRLYARKYYADNRDSLIEQARNYRKNNPQKVRESKRKHAIKHAEEIRLYLQKYRADHKQQCLEYQKDFFAKHPEKKSLYGKNYRKKYAEKIKNAHQKYREIHPELFRSSSRRAMRIARAVDPERFRKIARTYRQNNKEKVYARNAERRARKGGSFLNTLSHEQWQEIQETQNHCCYYCKKRCKGHLTQDHITPLSQGGSHTLHNVIGVCQSCNSRKGTGLPPVPVQPLLLTIAPAKKRIK